VLGGFHPSVMLDKTLMIAITQSWAGRFGYMAGSPHRMQFTELISIRNRRKILSSDLLPYPFNLSISVEN
jgi:hypothetical protein